MLWIPLSGMGASISTLHGMEKAKGKEYIKNWVAVIGDSTFMHTGVNSLMNMVYNKATGTVMILDNSTTGMTGHQDNPSTGKNAKGEEAPAVDIAALCRAIGVKNIVEIDPFDIKELEEVIKLKQARDELSVNHNQETLRPHKSSSRIFHTKLRTDARTARCA